MRGGGGSSLNRTNGKDSHVRLRTNFLSITCNELPSSTVDWVIACRTVSFRVGSSNPEGSLFSPFSKFLSLVSFFRVRLSVWLSFRVRVRIRVKVRF